MIGIISFIIGAYLFFKYLWPMIGNNDPKNRPTELYHFYDDHPKQFVITVIFAVFGMLSIAMELFSLILGFIFVNCRYDSSEMIDILCSIKQELGFI